MVKKQKKDSTKKYAGKGCTESSYEARKINSYSPYGNCSEQLSPFGVILALIKFLDLMRFEKDFQHTNNQPYSGLIQRK